MTKLASAIGINITFFDAVYTARPLVPWILERLHEDQIARETFDGPLELYRDQPRWGEEGKMTWCVQFLRSFRHAFVFVPSLTMCAFSIPGESTP